jgi:hypothetical protein
MALAATSLVAAIPAGIMAALGIMAFLTHTENMKPMVMVVTGGATAMGVLLALTPIIILVGKRQSKPVAAKAAKSELVPAGVSGAQTAEIVAGDLDAEADADADVATGEAEFTEAMDSVGDTGDTDDFQFEDDAFLDEEPEPAPEPKKKKKKK